jgi:hypothetical protein
MRRVWLNPLDVFLRNWNDFSIAKKVCLIITAAFSVTHKKTLKTRV